MRRERESCKSHLAHRVRINEQNYTLNPTPFTPGALSTGTDEIVKMRVTTSKVDWLQSGKG